MVQGYLFTYALISVRLFGKEIHFDLCAVSDPTYNVGAAFQPWGCCFRPKLIAAGKPLPQALVIFWP